MAFSEIRVRMKDGHKLYSETKLASSNDVAFLVGGKMDGYSSSINEERDFLKGEEKKMANEQNFTQTLLNHTENSGYTLEVHDGNLLIVDIEGPEPFYEAISLERARSNICYWIEQNMSKMAPDGTWENDLEFLREYDIAADRDKIYEELRQKTAEDGKLNSKSLLDEVKPIVGSLFYHDSGEVVDYTDENIFIKDFKDEMDYWPTINVTAKVYGGNKELLDRKKEVLTGIFGEPYRPPEKDEEPITDEKREEHYHPVPDESSVGDIFFTSEHRYVCVLGDGTMEQFDDESHAMQRRDELKKTDEYGKYVDLKNDYFCREGGPEVLYLEEVEFYMPWLKAELDMQKLPSFTQEQLPEQTAMNSFTGKDLLAEMTMEI